MCKHPLRCREPRQPSLNPANHGVHDAAMWQQSYHRLRRPYLHPGRAAMLTVRGGSMATRRHRLTQRRKAVGYTQEQLAEQLGVERTTVVRWEAGDTEPQPWQWPNLADALKLSVEQLTELL